jgi:hypothetical protein
MSWTSAQLRILRELGHEPMMLAPEKGVRPLIQDESPVALKKGSGPLSAALAAAIARAAGGRDVAALSLDLERLRRDPALKRALWPRLRALRREH